jgi:probable phosphoglycerate mutase
VPDPTTLILVRHGETFANTERVWHGVTDTPLSEKGFEQARAVARHLADAEAPASAIYTSQLQRAGNTAREIGLAQGIVPHIDPRIGEYDLGVWEGRPYAELLGVENFWTRIKEDPDFAPEGGESPRDVAKRFEAAVREVASTHAGERVVLVSHGGTMSLGLGWILEQRLSCWRRVMNNCAFSELVFEPEPSLGRFNESAHLSGNEPVDPRDISGRGDA